MTDFATALATFTDAVNKGFEEHAKQFDNLAYGTDEKDYFHPVTVMDGSKKVRIVQNQGNSGSAYCFVDKATGNILKSAGWNSAAKTARANIYKPETYQGAYLGSTGWLYAR